MKAYQKKESKFQYPDEMEKILEYLNKWGKLNISEEKVEQLYEIFSEEKYCAGWMLATDHVLLHFADWLSMIDIEEDDEC